MTRLSLLVVLPFWLLVCALGGVFGGVVVAVQNGWWEWRDEWWSGASDGF